MPNSTVTTGFNTETMQNLLLDSGAIYTNWGLTDEACVGACSGGADFSYKPTFREVKVDGLPNKHTKGTTLFQDAEASLKFNMLEMTSANFKLALNGNIDSTNTEYDEITPKSTIDDTDYLKNITYVGKLSTTGERCVIILDNALSYSGLAIKAEDSKDNTANVEFFAYFDPTDVTKVPVHIRILKATVPA